MKKLNNKENLYLLFLIKNKIKKNIKYFYKKIKKIIIFSKNNLNFIFYNQIFFFFSNINLIYLKNIIFIIKKFNILIYEEIPSMKTYILNLDKKSNYNNEDLKSNENIIKNYILIEEILLKINKNFTNNYYFIKIFISKLNNNKKIFNFNENSSQTDNLFKDLILKKKKIKFVKKFFFKKKFFYEFYFFLKNNFNNKEIIKNKFYKYIFKKIKFVNYNVNFNLDLFKEIYNIFFFYYKKIEYIRNSIYDFLSNISNLSFLEFIFYFNKNGSNINWVLNIINLKYLDKDFIKFYKKIVLKKKRNLKRIEKKTSFSIKLIIKIFSFLSLNKFKIDIIKDNILNSNLYLVNYVTNKYYKNNFYKDYIQEGSLGLIYSINKFNYKYKNFKNFAIFNIKSNINKFFYKSSRLINLPSTLIVKFKKINKFINSYLRKFNERPTIKYLNKKLKIPEKDIVKVLKIYNDPISLEKCENDDEDSNKMSIDSVKDDFQLTQEDNILNNQLIKILKEILIDFKKEHKNIIYMIYGVNNFKKYSYSEIGKNLKMTKKEILKIDNLFLNKIKNIDLFKKINKFFN